jgi:hypothetical protein
MLELVRLICECRDISVGSALVTNSIWTLRLRANLPSSAVIVNDRYACPPCATGAVMEMTKWLKPSG